GAAMAQRQPVLADVQKVSKSEAHPG
ncbi:MAG: hypothetical protein RL385_5708, partial [Pseudomonadota bacterium]